MFFLGFLPRSPGKLRRTVEAGLLADATVAFYESPLRLARTLALIAPELRRPAGGGRPGID